VSQLFKSQLTPNCHWHYLLNTTGKEHSVSVAEEHGKDLHHNSQARSHFFLHRPVSCPSFYLLLYLYSAVHFFRPNSWRRRPARAGEWGQIAWSLVAVRPSGRAGKEERAGEAISVSPPSATPSHRPTGDTIPLARYCTKLQTGKILQTLTVRLECGARLLPAANPHLHLVHHSWQTDMRRLVSHHKTCGLNYKKF
jgi:hypothetical protein